MKLRPYLAALCLGLSVLSGARAQDAAPAAPAAPSAADTAVLDELKAIIDGVGVKIRAGQANAETLAPDLAKFDALLAKHPEKTDATAQVAVMKAMLHLQVLQDEAKGRELLLAVKTDYAGTEAATVIDQILGQLDAGAKAKATLDGLAGKPAPELNFTWASKDGLKKLSDLKGQVVVLDFWATWCGPCLASFPQIRTHVEHFKGSPVAFVGVTSIQGFIANMGERIDTEGDPAKEIGLLPQFMKAKQMTWDVAVSEEPVFNPDYGIEGIPYLAIIAPDGTVRFAGIHPGDPAADVSGKIEAILKEFNLPVPAKS
jgi:thiol-disulfide isomerase/thioredoxin